MAPLNGGLLATGCIKKRVNQNLHPEPTTYACLLLAAQESKQKEKGMRESRVGQGKQVCRLVVHISYHKSDSFQWKGKEGSKGTQRKKCPFLC
eukprot:1151673-Pelagomonas_calceolata.AAC.2